MALENQKKELVDRDEVRRDDQMFQWLYGELQPWLEEMKKKDRTGKYLRWCITISKDKSWW